MSLISLSDRLPVEDGHSAEPSAEPSSEHPSEQAETVRIRGIVQGVGFRPTVYRLAVACGLRGEVCNDGEGVLIRIVGTPLAIDEFVLRLQRECPPLAKIHQIERHKCDSTSLFDQFSIIQSVQNTVRTDISPDAASCPECVNDVFDPLSRWYRYPFTNCTHCGPRLSIVQAIPYDRQHTSMAKFSLCFQCNREYDSISDRRFHAQPIACHACGPRAHLKRSDGRAIVSDMFSMMDDVDAVCTLLQKGEILAIKGIGGFHLACDATNEFAVQKLRQRKQRDHKPFALMARDLQIIEQYCHINPEERELLQSPAAPIVLLTRLHCCQNARRIAPAVAFDSPTLGFMLPYTPLHHLILKRMNRPIVLTSGNLSDEPQCISNAEAETKLGNIADYLLLHDRDIVNRIDDSVARVVNGQTQIMRRARGYAPAPIKLPAGFEKIPPILAMGGELKNTFALLRDGQGDGQAILSQHLGDLENAIAYHAYEETLNLYLNLFEHHPILIACDRHPEYLSTKLGQDIAHTNRLPVEWIQHHHAHIASCMAENGLAIDSEPVLGIALDGLGYGDDDTLWGGEFLLANYTGYKRLASLKPIAMVGGEQAIYQPWRNTYAQMVATGQWQEFHQNYRDLDLFAFLKQQPLTLIDRLIQHHLHSPLASSTGRLFDAVAAAIGIRRETCSYEGQAAIELEAVATRYLANHPNSDSYSFTLSPDNHEFLILDPGAIWQRLLNDLKQSVPPGQIAAKFHLGFAEAIVSTTQRLSQSHPFKSVALSGGVFQNRLLTQLVQNSLIHQGFNVLIHHQIPTNDGGLSLGQGAIAAARYLSR
ncbi:carbamoyltransferase HypF [Leptolyngbya ohadii]|uniref:carbamoyltransferase HypF n=1 Tax=Leptolyngbya ohadii TaxID=1962290 RepID=UPI000B59B69D|nr:carbamoyltransferase HypF [Leptolyngbya ohadii]